MMKLGQCVNDANGRTCEQIISWANFDDKQRICTVLDAQTVNFGYLVRYFFHFLTLGDDCCCSQVYART